MAFLRLPFRIFFNALIVLYNFPSELRLLLLCLDDTGLSQDSLVCDFVHVDSRSDHEAGGLTLNAIEDSRVGCGYRECGCYRKKQP